MSGVCNELEAICSPGGSFKVSRLNLRKEGMLCRSRLRPTGAQRFKLRLFSCFNSDKQETDRLPTTSSESESFCKLLKFPQAGQRLCVTHALEAAFMKGQRA